MKGLGPPVHNHCVISIGHGGYYVLSYIYSIPIHIITKKLYISLNYRYY
jgi:hypothetical protein